MEAKRPFVSLKAPKRLDQSLSAPIFAWRNLGSAAPRELKISETPGATWERRTASRMTKELMRKVLVHSLIRSFFHSHCSLICFLCTACFVCVLRCDHALECLCTRALRCAHEEEVIVHNSKASISYSFNPWCRQRLPYFRFEYAGV